MKNLLTHAFISKLSFLLYLTLPLCAAAQPKNIEPLLEAWKISDTSQTRLAELIYAPLRVKNDKKYYPKQKELVNELYQYLKKIRMIG